MPNHGHLIGYQEDQREVKNAIRLTLLTFGRIYPTLWEPIPEPAVVPDFKHLQRQVRYVHLNPCRSQLTGDPMSWEFSSHWDYLGFASSPISVPKVQFLGFPSLAQFHHYVSSDTCVKIGGTQLPRPVDADDFPIVTLHRVAEVSVLLSRTSKEDLFKRGRSRRLFLSLAQSAGYHSQSQVAEYLKISRQSVSEALGKGNSCSISHEKARALLSEPRLFLPSDL